MGISDDDIDVWFSLEKHVSCTRIYCQTIELYGDGITRVQLLGKGGERARQLSDIHDDDCSGRPIISRIEVNAAGLEELILEKPTCDVFRLLIS